jgi:hypothetical protein
LAIEYKTNWDAKWCDSLNEQVPTILADIKFDVWQSELNVSAAGCTYKIPGQKFIKIILTGNEKEYFVLSLKHGYVFDEKFPDIVRRFIRQNLKINI